MLSSWHVQAGQGVGPSFDCEKAKSRDEAIICGDTDLGKLDFAMANLYKEVSKQLSGSELAVLKAAQANWLESRKSCAIPELVDSDMRDQSPKLKTTDVVKCLRVFTEWRTNELAAIKAGKLTRAKLQTGDLKQAFEFQAPSNFTSNRDEINGRGGRCAQNQKEGPSEDRCYRYNGPERPKGFDSAVISITRDSSDKCVAKWSFVVGPEPDHVGAKYRTINSAPFLEVRTGDIAMGHSTETKTYYTYHKGRCYEIALELQTFRADEKDFAGKDKFKKEIEERMEKSLATFHFSDK